MKLHQSSRDLSSWILCFVQGNTRSMDLESMEIYIPADTEVKRIPLRSLPSSILRRMSLPPADTDGSRKPAESSEGIWICPAVLRKKGQKPASHTGSGVIESMSSLMNRDFRAAVGPFRMSFVSSSHTAYKVLKDTMPGKKVSTHTSRMSLLSLDATPRTYHEAVFIYQGRIYLSIRKPRRNQSKHETNKPQPATQSSVLSTSDVSSKSQRKRQSPQASLEPADKEVQRKRVHITLPQISQKQPKELLTKTDSADQELLNDASPKKKHTTCKAAHSENMMKKDVTHKGRDVSSTKTARSVPQSSDSVHSVHGQCHKDARGEQVAEEGASQEPAWFQHQGEQQQVEPSNDSETQYLDAEEPESTNQSSDMDSNVKSDSGEPDIMLGIVEQSSNQSWTRRESHSAAAASTSREQEFDFMELAQEERIARMKAVLRQKEGALKNLHFS